LLNHFASVSHHHRGSKILSRAQVAKIFGKSKGKEESKEKAEQTPSCYINYTRLIKRGMRGNDVKQVQRCMNILGYEVGPEDGIYGPLTYQGITNYQRAMKLKYIDGIVGPETSSHLNNFERKRI